VRQQLVDARGEVGLHPEEDIGQVVDRVHVVGLAGGIDRVQAGQVFARLVGSDGAGENLAGLYSLIATCEANGVNPVEYLSDVLIRVQTHPASRLDELLPHHWTPLQPAPSA
jgi:hypothetical protein